MAATIARSESTVTTSDGARLAVESLGEPGAPAVLLLGGGGWSRDWWDDELCRRVADRGRRVVRYDARDTGASTSWPVGEPGYGSADLRTDAIAILDGLGVDRAHVGGLSMGGGIAQELALAHRERVAGLTLIATTAIEDTGQELPGVCPELAAVFAGGGPEPDWSDPRAAVEALVEGERPFAGSGAFDEDGIRAIATRVVARSRDLAASMTNYSVLAESPPVAGALADLAGLPVTVVHGGYDPLFPPEHGRALARAIPGARLVEIDGMGHQLPPRAAWDVLVDALAA